MSEAICPNCGASDLDQDTITDMYHCNYCDERFPVDEVDEV